MTTEPFESTPGTSAPVSGTDDLTASLMMVRATSDGNSATVPALPSGHSAAPPPLDPQVGIELRVTRPGTPARRLRINAPRCTLGSGEGCTVRLSDSSLRPLHAVILRDGDRTIVRGYTVPIEVNGQATLEAPLKLGDVIRLGQYCFELINLPATTVDTPRPLPADPESDQDVGGKRLKFSAAAPAVASRPATGETLLTGLGAALDRFPSSPALRAETPAEDAVRETVTSLAQIHSQAKKYSEVLQELAAARKREQAQAAELGQALQAAQQAQSEAAASAAAIAQWQHQAEMSRAAADSQQNEIDVLRAEHVQAIRSRDEALTQVQLLAPTQQRLQESQERQQQTLLQLEAAEARCQAGESQLLAAESRCQDAVTRLQEAEARCQDAEVQLQDAETRCLDSQTRQQQADSQLHAVTAELETANAQLETANVQLETANAELEQTNAQLEQTNAQLEQTSAELETANAQLETANAQLEQTNAQLEQANAQLEQTSAELEQVSAQLDAANTQWEQTDAQLQLAVMRLQEADAQRLEIAEQLQEAQRLHEQVTEQHGRVAEEQSQWQQHEQLCQQLQHDLDASLSERDRWQDQARELQAAVDQLSQQLETSDRESIQQREHAGTYEAEIEQLRELLTQAEQELANRPTAEQTNELLQRLSESETQLAAAQQELIQLLDQYEQLVLQPLPPAPAASSTPLPAGGWNAPTTSVSDSQLDVDSQHRDAEALSPEPAYDQRQPQENGSQWLTSSQFPQSTPAEVADDRFLESSATEAANVEPSEVDALLPADAVDRPDATMHLSDVPTDYHHLSRLDESDAAASGPHDAAAAAESAIERLAKQMKVGDYDATDAVDPDSYPGFAEEASALSLARMLIDELDAADQLDRDRRSQEEGFHHDSQPEPIDDYQTSDHQAADRYEPDDGNDEAPTAESHREYDSARSVAESQSLRDYREHLLRESFSAEDSGAIVDPNELLPDDDFGDEEDAYAAAQEAPPTRCESRRDDEDDEDSVEAYMHQLLKRMGQEPEPSPQQQVQPRPAARAADDMVGEPAAAKVAAIAKPRRPAPERDAPLDKMRELANQTAESALSTSHQKGTKELRSKAMFDGIQAAVICLCGLAFVYSGYSSSNLATIWYMAAGLAFLLAGFFFYEMTQKLASSTMPNR